MAEFSVRTETAILEDEDAEEGIKNVSVGVIEVFGEMDIGESGVDRFRQIADSLIDREVRWVLVDLSQCPYVISRGFGQHLVALARLRTRSGDLGIVGAQFQEHVLSAAKTVGLDNIIGFHESVEAAIENLQEHGSFRKPSDN